MGGGKIGVVDVGGGMRGSFGAGVFDFCLDAGIWFDYAIGVSAGSANLTSYLAGQRGRNLVFYTDFAFRKEYMSLAHFMRTGNYINLDYIYSTLSNSDGEYPLDYPALAARGVPFDVVVTDAVTGLPDYFPLDSMVQDDYGAVKASCCVPGVNRPYAWHGGRYFDGGASDPIPFDRAFAAGCDRVVVVLTRPREYRRDPKRDEPTIRLLKRRYPAVAETMKRRAEVYNRQLEEALALEAEGRVLVIAPDAASVEGLKTLTKDRSAIRGLYDKGYEEAQAIAAFVQ
ncbi:patatin family protein [Eggerthellaceae bacterium zg-887]|nr:patatin family protein [Xiamenia xianingshaonis]